MTSPQNSDHAVQRVVLVNRYATPFAALLVLLAIFLPSPVRHVKYISLLLVSFSVLFNQITIAYIKSRPDIMPRLKNLRMYTNLGVNVVLVYHLGPYWPPIWLLLALTPIATAIYASPKQSLITSLMIASLIMATRVLQGGNSLVAWGQTLTCAAFVVFLSLLLNELAQEAGLNR
jgi:hypothetical protein